jgi:hypothetical protein
MSVILSLLYCPNWVSGTSLAPFHRLGRNELKIGIPKMARR